jgi:putative flippase GtrA
MGVRGKAARLWHFCHTPEGKKLVRYGAVSIVSALVAFTTLTLVYGVLRLWTEVPSAFFSNIVAGFVNYFLNRKWVWGKSGRSSLRREVLPFWIMSISGIVLALFTASWARNFSNAHQLEHWERTIVILGANSLAFGIVWVVKFLVLNRIFQPNQVSKKDVDADSGSQDDTEWEGSVP